ncbi:adenylate kinase [Myxococcota bacterium]|nr:adenylate kinase [Myxococcota bacterium]
MRLILLGAPGSGKGSQAGPLTSKFGILQISTGDMLREARANGTEMGKLAATFMDGGQLVPDEVVIGIVEERLKNPDCANGFILDGFPRTLVQAAALDEALQRLGIAIDRVVEIRVDDEVILPRITGRRSCPQCKHPYHIQFGPPKKDLVCDTCNVELVHRADDTEAAVVKRLEAYHKMTAPLVEYYEKQGKLLVVDGVGKVPEVTKRILEVLS